MRANYHTHCDFCDGKATAGAMAAAAHAAGYRVLGFSSHAPLPWWTDWCMQPARLGDYVTEVRRLGREWADRGLEVLLGLEIDWVDGETYPRHPRFADLDLDYRIGSVHYVSWGGAERFAVDESAEDLALHLQAAGGPPGRLWQEYYHNLSALVAAGGFDILGHFDVVRKNNAGGRYFSEDDPAYLAAALGVAAQLQGTGIVVEVNTGGMLRGKTVDPYPCLAVMKELCARGVPVTICADAHAPEHFGPCLDAARERVRAAGYRSIAVLSGGVWREVGLDET